MQYVHGSHKWEDPKGRAGSANQFFDKNHRSLLYDAARREGIADPAAELEITTVAVRAGGCGIHNGRLWHGSGRNESKVKPRRGIGIHFVPSNAVFREAAGRTLAHKVLGAAPGGGGVAAGDRPDGQTATSTELPRDKFPVTWEAG